MSHDVFISYSSKDKTIADAVCSKLEDQKIRCWIAPRDVPAGQNFAESIIKAINACKVFVLIWSANTNTSEHILNEINQAFDQGITIIPFRIQDVEPTFAMRYYFGRTHWLDAITPPLEKHIGTLAATILVNLGREAQGKSEPQPSKVEPVREEKKETKPPIKPLIKPEPVRQVKKKEEVGEFQPEGVAPAKKGILIPIAAGVLVVVALVVMFSLKVFKGSVPAAKTQVLLSSEKPIQQTATSIMHTATATPLPVVYAFSEPILAAIKDREPDFQDDFSKVKPDWTFEVHNPGVDCPNTSMKITNGKMQIKVDSECGAFANLLNLHLYNYVVQVDMDLQQLEKSYNADITISGYKCSLQRLLYIHSNGQWDLYLCDFYKTGFASFDPSDPVTITMISNGKENAIYVNAVPVIYFIDNEKPSKDNYLSLVLEGKVRSTSNNTVEFDNLKVWDLDKIENLN